MHYKFTSEKPFKMNALGTLKKEIAHYIDVAYFVKFAVLFTCLYFFNNLFVGVTQPGGTYFPFLADHFNYVGFIQNSVIHTSNFIAHILGIKSYVGAAYTLYNPDGSGVQMGWACAGLGVMSFWIAFVLADGVSLKKKLLWIVAGLLSIWVINCARITLLLVALNKQWEDINNMDHHEFFNICSYVVIGFMILLYTTYAKKQEQKKAA